ncbi:hypothetical protein TanjilG_01438 [Lupinus angustifolius]|uniref:Dynein light chain 1, cytoplasmic n=1 Tax=Lupinus angustifolius TaxID=3871 RepID=A0A4P1QVV8_LUPAN|nr:hypothetical protein TanjilG_01438 [Lupinus angustifolius]
MSEDTKYNTAGALTVKPISDDRKLSQSSAAAAAAPTKKVIIKSADMLLDMQKEAIDIAVAAFEKYNVEKDVAEQIKKEFDKRHGPTWHCIVGRNFALMHVLYFYTHRSLQEGNTDSVLYEVSSGLDASIIGLLPIFTYNPNICLGNPLNCVICLSEFQEGEMGRVLPKCNHMFHVDCIDMWLYSHTTCPHCRVSVELTSIEQTRPNIVDDLCEPNFGSSSTLQENRSESSLVMDP